MDIVPTTANITQRNSELKFSTPKAQWKTIIYTPLNYNIKSILKKYNFIKKKIQRSKSFLLNSFTMFTGHSY